MSQLNVLMPVSVVFTPLNLALLPLPPICTTVMTSLFALLFLWAPVLRPGWNPYTNHPSNLEAWLGQVTSQVQVAGCRYCIGSSSQ